jgi:hypothetical protein
VVCEQYCDRDDDCLGGLSCEIGILSTCG